MFIDFLLDVFRRNAESDAVVWKRRAYTYTDLLTRIRDASTWLDEQQVLDGEIVALEADFSPRSIGMMLALIERRCCVVPLTSAAAAKKDEFLRTSEAETVISIDAADGIRAHRTGVTAVHDLLHTLRRSGHPGLVLFSSGSTGVSKAALHDFVPLLEKFRTPRQAKRMMTFLLFDHIGGVNTLLYVLSNGGCVVTTDDRSPTSVAEAIQDFRVQVLPTSPTFLNLLLLSGAHRHFDLSSLELITYGTEPMPESTLRRIRAALPDVALQQTYGLSELGILRSKSRSSDSLWVKIGGEGFETRVVDGLLEVKARSAMLGYLNAESPFTPDGWFRTGDMVEVDGDYFRFLGRRSELINVGGEKVYPAEIESVIQELPEVEEVVVRGEPNALVGNIVTATVRLKAGVAVEAFKRTLQVHCRSRLEAFKVPQRIILHTERLHSDRFKKQRGT